MRCFEIDCVQQIRSESVHIAPLLYALPNDYYSKEKKSIETKQKANCRLMAQLQVQISHRRGIENDVLLDSLSQCALARVDIDFM